MPPAIRTTWKPLDAWLRCSPVTLLRVAFGAFVLSLIVVTKADADLWGHLRFGLDTLSTGSVHGADPYSFTSDRAWINHEWLAELLMAIAYSALGAAGLNLLKLACIAVVGGIVAAVAREENATPWARDVFIALVVFAVYTRMQAIRPQLFSVVLFGIMISLVRRFDRGRPRAAWGIPVVFAAWVNLHGGWLVGLGTLAVWVGVGAIRSRATCDVPAPGATQGGLEPRRARGVLLAIGVGSVVATLANPYGMGLWRFLAETVRLARPGISDWKPLLELPPPIIAIEMVLPAVALLCLARSGWRVPLRYAAMVAVLVFATFRIGRTDAFAQMAIAVLFAPQIVAGLNALERRLLGWRPSLRRRSIFAAAVAAGIVVVTAGVTARAIRTITIKGPWIPDANGAIFIRDAYPGARVLTWFDWGEYALWHLSPSGARVSMDGRRETVYSDRVLADHFRFYQGKAGSEDYPERISADVVWLPADFPSVPLLVQNGWLPVFTSPRSVVLARKPTALAGAISDPVTSGIFPGP